MSLHRVGWALGLMLMSAVAAVPGALLPAKLTMTVVEKEQKDELVLVILRKNQILWQQVS